MSSITCPKCKGLKRRLGLGLLEKDCLHCNKTGRVSVEPTTETPAAIITPENDSTKLRDDLHTLSTAYTQSQAEVDELKAQLAQLSANKSKAKESKSVNKGK